MGMDLMYNINGFGCSFIVYSILSQHLTNLPLRQGGVIKNKKPISNSNTYRFSFQLIVMKINPLEREIIISINICTRRIGCCGKRKFFFRFSCWWRCRGACGLFNSPSVEIGEIFSVPLSSS